MASINIPNIGTDEAVEIIEIMVQPGDVVEKEQSLLVLESDKASMDVPSPVGGKLQKILVKVGDKVKEGDAIAEIEAADDGDAPAPKNEEEKEEKKEDKKEEKPDEKPAPKEEAKPAPQPTPQAAAQTPAASSGDAYAGPAVRKLAREFGIDLTQVPPSGENGRIVKEDLHNYVKNRLAGAPTGGSALPPEPVVDFSEFGKVTEQEMDKIKRLTAEGMQSSAINAPHVTQFDEADVTDLETFRGKKKKQAEKKKVKLTPVPFIIKALALALKEFPQFNASLRGNTIIQKHYYNIGVAVDTPAGLVVPVIKEVDKKGIWELAKDLGEISENARNRRISPKDLQGGCITLSSLGRGGGTQFTPIINLPEVAILGVSRVDVKPLWQEDKFVPRSMMPVALSYDHRAVNGVDGANFTRFVCSLLSDPRNLSM